MTLVRLIASGWLQNFEEKEVISNLLKLDKACSTLARAGLGCYFSFLQ